MASLIRATVCTANPHKLQEFRDLFPGWELDALDAADYPAEDGVTFLDNARIKARYGRLVGAAERWMLADDSGIEVAALGGGPGVQTARWAGDRHVEKLLAALDGRDDRAARYVCELVAIGPDGEELRGTGVLEGTIAHAAGRRRGLRLRSDLRPARRDEHRGRARRRLEGRAFPPSPRGPGAARHTLVMVAATDRTAAPCRDFRAVRHTSTRVSDTDTELCRR